MSRDPRVVSIAPGSPFLTTLVHSFLDGTLLGNPVAPGDPLALADATIYVPTRRAARALRSCFVETMPGAAAVLPRIRPLGDFDEEADFFSEAATDALALAPPLSGSDRIQLLAQLIRAWRERIPDEIEARIGERLVMPTSSADAIWFAGDLAGLIDEVETEDSDWLLLDRIADDDVAQWWQVTRRFLDIVTEAWPSILSERQRSSPAVFRREMILAEARRLEAAQPDAPVIAAGSTGSIPATAQLLSVISRLPNGCIVLPGLDIDLDDASFGLLRAEAGEPALFGHPQFGLARLLETVGCRREQVREIGTPPPALAARARFLSEALRPADTTDAWSRQPGLRDEVLAAGALDAVTYVEAANEREEAETVALVLRNAIEEDAATAALVTGDRNLARRVSVELARYGIRADDSGGTPLASTPGAALARLLVLGVCQPGDAMTVSGLVKHPWLRLELDAATASRAARTIDLVALRGGAGRITLTGLRARFESRLLDADTGGDRYLSRIMRSLPQDDLAAARIALDGLQQAVAPLAALAAGGDRITTAAAAAATATALEALCRDAEQTIVGLYAGDVGERLATWLRDLVGANEPLDIDAGEWPQVVDALLAGETVKPEPGGHPRLFIWGALEARLQHVDTLVVAGLNEGSWPPAVRADRFLSRAMKASMNLEPPERRLGLAAHDFATACLAPNVVLTRSARSGDAPAIASRWLQRIMAYAGEAQTADLRARGDAWLDAVREIGSPADGATAPRPSPRPAPEHRPHRYSVSDIETLIRDPYAVYARKILHLYRLEPLVAEYGPRERGTLIHAVLEEAIASGADLIDMEAFARLQAIADRVIADNGLPADIVALWRPRIAASLAEFLDWERQRDGSIARRLPETASSPLAIADTGTELTARADRIDLLRDGTAAVIDYKTGSYPSIGQAHILLAPQLALEAALLTRGGFREAGTRGLSDLLFLRLKADGSVEPQSILKHGRGADRSEKTADELAGEAWDKLVALMRHFGDPETGFLSRRMPFREGESGDYDHLARVREWASASEGDEG